MGRVDGDIFEGGTGEDYPLVLGSNSFIPGFEDQLVGVKVDDKKAVYWYNKAAQQGHPRAQYNLGVMYLLGKGIYKSFEEAKPWLQLAYENGVDEAKAIWDENKLWKY